MTIFDQQENLRGVIYFTKGLGDVVISEVSSLSPTAEIIEQTERFALLQLDWQDIKLVRNEARTIDDLRALVAGPADITTPEQFERICAVAGSTTKAFLERYDPPRLGQEPWSVTVSARNPAWRKRPPWDPAPIIAKYLHGADIQAKSRQPLDLRIQVDEDRMHISVNLLPQPVGKQSIAPIRQGALRQSVAAALVRLAVAAAEPTEVRLGVYDPFCGTGTIVAEAAQLGLPIFASDIDEEAVELTRSRLRDMAALSGLPALDPDADLRHRVFVHDIRRGIPSRVNAHLIVSNLPWGKQIKVDRHSELFDSVAELVARAIDRGGSCALLTTHEDQLMARIRKQARRAKVTSRRIGLLGQTPAIVVAQRA